MTPTPAALNDPLCVPTENPALVEAKARQHAAWSAGNFAVIGTTLQIVGETLCEAVDLRAGSRVLDVATGNGNAALAAARRWCDVVGVDYVPALLDSGRARAAASGLDVTFQTGDAEALNYADESFDVVLSVFGVMFTPDQDRAAAELLRVCRRGGRIGLAHWTPEGFIGQLFATVGRHVPPAPGVPSPLLWGTRAHMDRLFGQAATSISAERRDYVFRYRSADHWLEVFRTWYGPTLKAFAAVGPKGEAALAADIHALIARFNRSGDSTVVIPAEYLEVVIERR